MAIFSLAKLFSVPIYDRFAWLRFEMGNCVSVFSNQFDDVSHIWEYTVSRHHTWSVHTRDISIYCWFITWSAHWTQKTASIANRSDAPFSQSIQWFYINLQRSIWFIANFCFKSQRSTLSPSLIRSSKVNRVCFLKQHGVFCTKNSMNRCDLIKMFLTLPSFDLLRNHLRRVLSVVFIVFVQTKHNAFDIQFALCTHSVGANEIG